MGNSSPASLRVFPTTPDITQDGSLQTPGADISGHCATVDREGRMWVFGGRRLSTGDYVKGIRYLDLETGEWHIFDTLGPAPEGRIGATLIADPSVRRLYVFGGKQLSGRRFNTLHVLDIDRALWAHPASQPYGHRMDDSYLSLLDLDRGKFLVMFSPKEVIVTCKSTFLDQGIKETKGDFPLFNLTHDKVFRDARRIVVFGEINNMISVYEYLIDTYEWRKIETKGKSPIVVGHYSVVGIGNRAYICGGVKGRIMNSFRSNKNEKMAIYSLDLDNRTWEHLVCGMPYRIYHTAISYQQKMYVYGGCPKGRGTVLQVSFSDPFWNVPFEREVQVKRRLGEGAYGTVFEALWRGETIAAKLLKAQNISQDESIWDDFMHEMNIMRGIHHPNIINLYGACSTAPNLSLLLEYAERGDLRSLLLSRDKLSWKQRLSFAVDIADGMTHLHNQMPPILHRDLKTENCLVTHDYRIKITDFGFAKVKQHTVTLTGQAGTPFYAAPEILREAESRISSSVDVYSLAIVMWEIFFRRPVFHGKHWTEVTQRIVNEDLRPKIPPLEKLKGNSEVEIARKRDYLYLMKRAWHPNPDKRPSMEKMVILLKWIRGDYDHEKPTWFIKRLNAYQGKLDQFIAELEECGELFSGDVFLSEQNISTNIDSQPISDEQEENEDSCPSQDRSCPSTVDSTLGQFSMCTRELDRLISLMKEGGVQVKDRTSFLRTYENCFLGSEATTWLSRELVIPREHAVTVGNALKEANLIEHVSDTRKRFLDGSGYYYRFVESERGESSSAQESLESK